MRCRRCGREVSENEIFCSDCKNEMREVSSREDVSKLESLIEQGENLNGIENTKELTNLDSLVEEELLKSSLEEEIKEDESKNVDIKPPKKPKKKLIILISIISVLVIGLTVLIVFLIIHQNQDKKQDESSNNPNEINYQNVINDYGAHVEDLIKNYISENDDTPTWQQISELITYNEYEVICDTHNIYKDGSIYLTSCKVDDKSVEYSYGELKEEQKEGKKIEIYKIMYDDEYYSYSDRRSNGSTSVGTITCDTDTCQYIAAYDKYALIKGDNKYYLYNYENNSLEFGPFNMYDDYSYAMDLLSYNNVLYGIYYDDGTKNIYNVVTGKTFKNIKGELLIDEMGYSPSLMYKYGYAIFENNKKYEFLNLKTGNISYSIDKKISEFVEDVENNIVYMTSYDSNNKEFQIYNSNGKLLFDGNKFTEFAIGNGNLLVSSGKKFQVYDSKLILKTSSKEYDEVLGLYSDFVVVIDNNRLEILDINDNILTTFDFEWDSKRYKFYPMISGFDTVDGKYGIYLVVEDLTVPFGTLGSGLKCYYISSSKETGIIKTSGVEQ